MRTLPAVRKAITLDTLKSYVLQGGEHGGGLVIFEFHKVCDGCDEYAVSRPVLEGFLSWVSKSGVTIRRFGDLLSDQPV
jgi:hypothetical protein